MGWKFNPFTGALDQTGSTPASYIDGEVATYNDLPLSSTTAPLDTAWLVRSASGVWPVSRKQAGIYIRTATAGSSRDADYTYAGTMPDVFSDANFTIYDDADTSKNLKFQLSGLATGTTSTLTVPASGTIARTEDFAAPPSIGSTTPNSGAFTTLTANNGTLTASAPVLDLSQTWNNAAVTFTGLRFNVTNTASALNSRLLEFQVDGTRRLSFDVGTTPAGNPPNRVDLNCAFTDFFIVCNGLQMMRVSQSNNWVSSYGASLGILNDCFFARDGSDQMSVRRGTNSQTFRIYSTYSSATSFERLNIAAQSAGSFIIGTEKGSGGGTARGLELRTDNTARITLSSTGGIGFYGAAAAAQPTAVADATDAATVITQLNALLSRMRTIGLIAT